MPAGRPSSIDHIVGTRPDGTGITAADRILEILRIGGYFEEACAAAGISRETGYEWLRRGAQAHAALTRNPKAKITAHERRCLQFSDAKARAEAEWEAMALGELERMARGGRQLTTTTEKRDAEGNVIETTTRTETLAPNARVLMWRLERRYPNRYAGRIEVTGAEGGPLISAEERASAIASQAVEYLENVTSIESAPTKRAAKKAPARRRKAAAT